MYKLGDTNVQNAPGELRRGTHMLRVFCADVLNVVERVWCQISCKRVWYSAALWGNHSHTFSHFPCRYLVFSLPVGLNIIFLRHSRTSSNFFSWNIIFLSLARNTRKHVGVCTSIIFPTTVTPQQVGQSIKSLSLADISWYCHIPSAKRLFERNVTYQTCG